MDNVIGDLAQNCSADDEDEQLHFKESEKSIGSANKSAGSIKE